MTNDTEKKSWAEKIACGEVSACPACGQKLVRNDTLLLFECSAPKCLWSDALADSAEMGLYQPPEGWRVY